MAETKHHPGFLLVGTEAERGAYSTTGLKNQTVWLESDTGSFYIWNGSEWQGTWTGTPTDTVWDDIRVSANTIRFLGLGADPSWSQFQDDGGGSNGVYAFSFSSGSDEEVTFSVQIPHSYKEGSTIYPHVHWAPSNANAGGVTWALEYTWSNINGTFPNTSTMLFQDSTDSTAHKHHMATNATGIDGTGKTISSMIMCRLYRDVSDPNDTYGSNAFLLEFDIHFEMDTAGSQQVASK